MPGQPPSLERLPRFGLDEYADLLKLALARGFQVNPVSALAERQARPTLFLRHDIDFYPQASVHTARIEADLGVRSTYYFLLTGPYNLHEGRHHAALSEIANLGHECGLHYDLTEYPSDPAEATERLAFEARTLEALSGQPVITISTHNPHRGGDDFFKNDSDYVHPHESRFADGLVYVSDSRREWRDNTLLEIFANETLPDRFMLLTHPESWAAPTITDNLQYLREIVDPAAIDPHREFFQVEIPRIWMKRSPESANLDPREFDQAGIQSCREEILSCFASDPDSLPCDADLLDRAHSALALLSDGQLVACSLNSHPDGDTLQFEAFFVHPEFRGQTIGRQLLHSLVKQGHSILQLEVDSANTRAIHFFLKHGFEISSLDPGGHRLRLQRHLAK